MASEINAELMLEIKGFLEGIKKSQSAATKFSKKGKDGASSWTSSLKKVAGGLVAVGKAAMKAAALIVGVGAAVAGAMAAGVKNAFDMGGKFSDIAAQIGSTAGEARVLASAFEANGMSADAVATTVNKMSKSINDGLNGLTTSKRAFDALGLSAEELSQMDPTTAFAKISEALRGIENDTIRTGVAMDIFGHSGGKLNVLLNDPKALENARNMIGGQAALLDEHAGQFDRASDVLNQMGTKVQGFFVGVGAKIIEQIMPAIEFINEIDLTTIGERFGEALSKALDVAVAIYQTFQGMRLAEIASLFGTALKLAASNLVNFLFAHLSGVFRAVGSIFVERIKTVISLLAHLTTGEFWAGLEQALLAAAQGFGALLLSFVADILTGIKERSAIARKLIGDTDENMRAAAESAGAEADKNKDLSIENLGPFFKTMEEGLKREAKAAVDSYKDGFESAKKLVDTAKSEDELGSFADRILSAVDQLQADRDNKKAETGEAGEGEGGDKTQSGLPRLNSRLAGALNTIAGRSANAVIAAEAAKTSENTERTAKATEQIAENTKPPTGGNQPTPKPTASGAGRFG